MKSLYLYSVIDKILIARISRIQLYHQLEVIPE